ncbi:MAG: hypothetical protein ABSH48_24860 [Verrucomicrobiota bacterium]
MQAVAEHKSVSALARDCIFKASRRALPPAIAKGILGIVERLLTDAREKLVDMDPSSCEAAVLSHLVTDLKQIQDLARLVPVKDMKTRKKGANLDANEIKKPFQGRSGSQFACFRTRGHWGRQEAQPTHGEPSSRQRRQS